MVFTMEIGWLAIFTIMFVISVSKYVNMEISKEIGEFTYSELHPMVLHKSLIFLYYIYNLNVTLSL